MVPNYNTIIDEKNIYVALFILLNTISSYGNLKMRNIERLQFIELSLNIPKV